MARAKILEHLVNDMRLVIQARLAHKNRTAQALGDAVDLHRNTLHLWLSDQRENISLTTLRKLAAWLDHNAVVTHEEHHAQSITPGQ